MTTQDFYQIASCASIIHELAQEGVELSNAVNSSLDNAEFEEKAGRKSNFIEFTETAKRLDLAKQKIEASLRDKNEELQKLINE